MPGAGEIFLEQVRAARTLNIGRMDRPSYFDQQMSSGEANTIPWEDFREKIKPIASVKPADSELECLLIPKNIGWGVEDANLYAGRNSTIGAEIQEIDDLGDQEGSAFLRVNLRLAEQLIKRGHGDSVEISIGFNPQDFSEGHHTVKKLHSHVRITPNELDLERRHQCPWEELDRFDRLAFIEPFASVFYDHIVSATAEGVLDPVLTASPEQHLGYTSLELKRFTDESLIFPGVKALYAGMKAEHNIVESIFTDGTCDSVTGRYIARDLPQRRQYLQKFLQARQGVFSAESVRALEYLADHIRLAAPRPDGRPREISSSAMAYITRGFAGAISFTLDKNSETIRMDFLPRVISTSGVSKTIMGKYLPTAIGRMCTAASDIEKRTNSDYYQKLVSILCEEFPDECTSFIGDRNGNR